MPSGRAQPVTGTGLVVLRTAMAYITRAYAVPKCGTVCLLQTTARRGATAQAAVGGGTLRFLGLRSRGPIAVSASIISLLGLLLGGSSTGSAVASTAVASTVRPVDQLSIAASRTPRNALGSRAKARRRLPH